MRIKFNRFMIVLVVLYTFVAMQGFCDQIASDGRMLFRINGTSLQSSTDMGRTWMSRSHSTPSMGNFLDLLVFKGRLYAVTQHGIYRSNDSGMTWENVCSNLMSRGDFQDIMSPDGITLMATTSKGWIYRSSDDGRTWERC